MPRESPPKNVDTAFMRNTDPSPSVVSLILHELERNQFIPFGRSDEAKGA